MLTRLFALPCILLALSSVGRGPCAVHGVTELYAEAREGDAAEDILGQLAEALPEGYGELADPEVLVEKITFSEIWAEVIRTLGGERGYVGGVLLTLMGLAVLLALAELGGGELSGSSSSIAGAVVGSVAFSVLAPAIVAVADALAGERELMGALLPLMTATEIAGGGAASAGVLSSGAAITLWVLGYLAEPLLMALVYAMLLVGIAGSTGGGTARLASGVRSGFGRLLAAVSAAFSGVIALQSVIATAQDNALMRVAKHATGTLVPIVGAGVSGALGTLAGGLAYTRDVVGGAGVGVIVLISVSPLVLLLLLKLAVFIAASLLDFCHATRAAAIYTALEGGINALISVYVLTTMVCIIQLVLFIKGGVRVFG